MAIAGFVCSFICGLLGLILSVIGYNECKRSNGTVSGQGLALAGLIISIISTGLTVLGILAAVAIPSFLGYTHSAKSSEARIQLRRIERAAKSAYAMNAEFPKGQGALTPDTDCCSENYGGRHKCGIHPEAWATPAWQALDFQIDEPHLFRYSYQSDGQTFTAQAVGDLDCDGQAITYELQGRVVEGNPVMTTSDPLPGSD
jgi:type II secretory pathway pseudopilin PulG